MLNVHRQIAPAWEDLPLWRKSLILMTFPVWGPLLLAAMLTWLFLWVAYFLASGGYELFVAVLEAEMNNNGKT